MVNYGQPSRDCFPCRKRKLRVGEDLSQGCWSSNTYRTALGWHANVASQTQCDLQPKGCSQCRRAGLTCYGYRNLNELGFRDETYTTAQKALTRQASPLPLAAPVQLSWDEQAQNAFLALYVVQLSHSFSTLGPLLAKSPAAGYLHASVNAASLAFIAFQRGIPGLLPLANLRYLDAIQSLRLALRSSQHSGSDEVLQSVLLLDLYEKFAYCDAQQRSSWMCHALGAVCIARSCTNNNLSSPVSCQLANRAATVAIISCGAAGVPLPDTLAPLQKDLGCYVRDTKWSFMNLMVSIVKLRADMRGAASSSGGSTGDFQRARELDQQLAIVESKMPRSWKPRRVLTTTYDSLVFGRYYDIYSSHYATQVSNAIRMMRLEMCAIIRNLGSEEQSDASSPVSKTISEVTRQICAALPQFLLPGARAGNTVPLSPLQMLQCCTMLTPLYISAQLTADCHLRDWILRCMAHMADNGVKMSQDVSHILYSTPKVEYWTVYARVGSYAIAA